MKKWLTVDAFIEIVIIAYVATMLVLGATTWPFWIMLLIAVSLCGLRPDFAVIMIAATVMDVWAAVSWLGRQVAKPVQKMVDKAGL